MPTVQGEFPSAAAARQAVDSLTRAGVREDRIRCWNIVTEAAASDDSDGGSTFGGAVLGGLVGGAPGLAIGAAVGKSLDEGEGDEGRLAASSGLRVAVDSTPDGPDVATLLRKAGAANVETLPG